MTIEELHDDLYAIAKHVGPLDAEAVRAATSILALPRYAGQPNLLVEDLERVIETISPDTLPDEPAGVESASRYLQRYARRYFSLEAAGQTLEHRRSFGKRGKQGTLLTWMNRGVGYRVAAGLLELWAETDAESPPPITTGRSGGYRLDTVDLTRHVTNGSLFQPMSETLTSHLTLFASGPHVLLLPFERRGTRLGEVAPQQPGTYPPPQLISINLPARRPLAGVVLSGEVGEQLRVSATYAPRKRQSISSLMNVTYRVDQPMGTLWLGVEYDDRMHEWHVAENGVREWRVGQMRRKASWSQREPDVGKTYRLSGDRTREDREEEHTVQREIEYAMQGLRDRERGQQKDNML